MHPLLPPARGTRVAVSTGRLDSRAIAGVDALVVLLPERARAAIWKQLPRGERLRKLAGKAAGDGRPVSISRADNPRQTCLAVTRIKADAPSFECLTAARQALAEAAAHASGCLGVAALGFGSESERIEDALVAAGLAMLKPMPQFKRKPAPNRFRSLRLLGAGEKRSLARLIAEAEGNHLARWLTALPPNRLDASAYRALAKDLATRNGWQYKAYTTRELKKLGAGAFLAVAQGNGDDSAAIVRLRYRPDTAAQDAAVALVGKGIVFDTGGTNLKPFESMLDMHGDMQGSAVALGTLLALSRLAAPFPVDCWLALTENRTGPRAYKPQDVITALNGKTIQTIHTDAEGRLVLADTLTLASREAPAMIFDYATLTGACVNAVTTRYSGVFTNRPDWHPRLKQTGMRCGERVWPFPIGKEFLEELQSPIADLMQCSVKSAGDHILAASFLAEFVGRDIPWVHIDLAAGEREGGLAHIPSRFTGFGVRYTLALLLDNELAAAR